jgi:hypothetical protein
VSAAVSSPSCLLAHYEMSKASVQVLVGRSLSIACVCHGLPCGDCCCPALHQVFATDKHPNSLGPCPDDPLDAGEDWTSFDFTMARFLHATGEGRMESNVAAHGLGCSVKQLWTCR